MQEVSSYQEFDDLATFLSLLRGFVSSLGCYVLIVTDHIYDLKIENSERSKMCEWNFGLGKTKLLQDNSQPCSLDESIQGTKSR